MGKLTEGCEATETINDNNDEYKNGSESKVSPRDIRHVNIRNEPAAFDPIRNDNPTPIFDIDFNLDAKAEPKRKVEGGLCLIYLNFSNQIVLFRKESRGGLMRCLMNSLFSCYGCGCLR